MGADVSDALVVIRAVEEALRIVIITLAVGAVPPEFIAPAALPVEAVRLAPVGADRRSRLARVAVLLDRLARRAAAALRLIDSRWAEWLEEEAARLLRGGVVVAQLAAHFLRCRRASRVHVDRT